MRRMALFMSMLVGACSTTSTIHRPRGPAYEAEIVSSDASGVNVLGDDRQIYKVPREEVTDIDHPGNVVLTVGAALAALGALVAISISSDSASRPAAKDDAIAVALVYGLPGAFMMVAGGATYLTSRSNARAFERGRYFAPLRPTDEQYHPPFPPRPPASPPPAPWAPPAAPPAPTPPTGGSAVPPPDGDAAPDDEPQVIPAPAAPPAPPR